MLASLRSMCDELLKISFSAQDARRMLAATRGKTVRAGSRIGLGYGVIPSKKFVGKEQSRLVGEMTSRGVEKGTAGKAISNLKKQQLESLPFEDPEAWSRGKDFMISPGKGDAAKMFRGLGVPGMEAVKTPKQRMMGEAYMKGHEMAEMAGLKKPMQSFRAAGHMSPEVILKEHNMLVTSPKSVREAWTPAMTALRQPAGEAAALKHVGVEYGKSPRFSRHARKRIAELLEKETKPALEAGYGELASMAPTLAKG